MTTMKQIEANRRNAQSSTGPATAEGRKNSSKNAWKHGLTAREVTVDEAEAKSSPRSGMIWWQISRHRGRSKKNL
jgi:hypothetical protein